jgi:hypothetical protein
MLSYANVDNHSVATWHRGRKTGLVNDWCSFRKTLVCQGWVLVAVAPLRLGHCVGLDCGRRWSLLMVDPLGDRVSPGKKHIINPPPLLLKNTSCYRREGKDDITGMRGKL